MKYLLINENNEICVTNNREDSKEFSGGYACTVINLGNLTFSGGEKIPEYAPRKIRLKKELECVERAVNNSSKNRRR